jgi:chitosanase
MALSMEKPCTDCEQWRQTLEDNDYEFIDCRPSTPPMCTIRYRFKGSSAAAQATDGASGSGAAAAVVAPTTLMAEAMAAGASLMTGVQERTAKAIVNLFETSQVTGDYAAVTVLAGDSGHLSYGRSQATLGSGTLHLLLERYCANAGARFGPRLLRWSDRVKARDESLDHDERLKNVLRACTDDPVMRDVQDRFFDQHYWMPAVRAATQMGARLPLGICIVYDSHVHGSWRLLKAQADAQGAFDPAREQEWMRRYVALRRKWLAGHSNPALHPTVYRMDAFARLMDQGYWGLPLPLLVRGQEISVATLSAPPTGCYDGPEPGTRTLAVQSGGLLRGLDVRLLQLALSDLGADIMADGVFGATSARRVREYQARTGHPPTGVADPQLVAAVLEEARSAA